MSPYETSGSLTSSQKQISVSGGWDTQSEWSNYQSSTNVDVSNGVVTLAQTTALPSNTVDNFDSELYDDVGNTLSAYYSGDLSSFSRDTNAPVFDGSYSLKTATSTNMSITSQNSGLPNYPSQGGEFIYRFYDSGTSDSSRNFELGWAPEGSSTFPNGYAIRFESALSDISIVDTAGNVTLDSTIGVSFPSGEWVDVHVDTWTSSEIHVTIQDQSANEIATLSTADANLHPNPGVFYNNYDDDSNEPVYAIDAIYMGQ